MINTLRRLRKRLLRAWRVLVRERLDERVWLWAVLTGLIFGRGYPGAQRAVRKAARDPSLASVKGERAWQRVTTRVAYAPGLAENALRHFEASEWTAHYQRDGGVVLPTHRRELLVELAYLALKERGH